MNNFKEKTKMNQRIFNRNLNLFPYHKKFITFTSDNNNHYLIPKIQTKTKTKSCLTSLSLSPKCKTYKESPTLCFPPHNASKLSLNLTPYDINFNTPLQYRNKTVYKNSIANNNNFFKKKIIKSKLNRPVINMKLAKIITDKLKHLNILDFGNHLKIYDEKEKKHKKKVILDKIEKTLDEIYYDYDKKNKKVIVNSFAGNNADLLRNKISFVSGIMNYLYPKIVLNKMEFLKKMKYKELRAEKIQVESDLKGALYNLKYKTPKENAAISKYIYMDDFDNLKFGQYLTRPKTMVNNNVVSKLKYGFEFM